MKKILTENNSKKIKGKNPVRKSGRKTRNQVTKLPEIAVTLYQSEQKAGKMKKNQVT